MAAGAALHWGPVALGTIGEVRRLDATAISDTVNTASRLETITKTWGAPAIVSGDLMQRVDEPERFPHRFIGTVVLRGRESATPIYDLFAVEEPATVARRLETHSEFEHAVGLLHERELGAAAKALSHVLAHDPDDRVARYLVHVASAPPTSGAVRN
jgi:hypothetical protein